MLTTDLFDDTYIFNIDNRKFRYIRMLKKDPNEMFVWEEMPTGFGGHGSHNLIGKSLSLSCVGVENLKKIGIWNSLSEDTKKALEIAPQMAISDKMEKARASKRNKYPNIPKEIECIQCHAKEPVSPSITAKKIENINLKRGFSWNIDDYLKQYKCAKCEPRRRGKAANPEFSTLPKKLVCKCGYEAILNPSILKTKAEKLGVTIQHLIDNYKCQTCEPTRRGRKAKK